jgi:putative endonuclease
MRTKDAVGQYGEELAARYLTEAGFAILERNWRCELGEIDIVAREGATLVVCEVKTRRGLNYGSPLESVTYRKLATLRRLVGRWLQEHDVRPAAVRIDVLGVVCPHSGAATVDHVKGVA